MRQSDLVLYLFDARENPEEIRAFKSGLDQQQVKYLLVANKIDAVGESEARGRLDEIEKVIYISAKSGDHIELLKERMVDEVLGGQVQTENTIVTNARHYHALKEASKSLRDIKSGLDNHLPGDLLALDIRRSLHYLGEITGQVSSEDMLDYIFSKFCIGK
jgi:tRNA modification GTPase